MWVGNAMLLLLNLPLIGVWVKVIRVPYGILAPLIILLCIIGAYSAEGNPGDVLVLMIFGGLGYLIKKLNLDSVPLILGLILGPMLEEHFRRSLLFSKGSFAIFFNRPITLVSLILTALILISPVLFSFFKQRLKGNPNL
jgi:TctA family transporter